MPLCIQLLSAQDISLKTAAPAGVLAPKSKADLAFIMHSLAWLASNGTAAIVCFPGIMYRGGAATIEMHKDAIKPGQKVVIVDDLIATGGTTEAIIKLVEELGGKVVKAIFLMELAGLEGRKKLAGYDVDSVIIYPGK